jgi:hypothetical protein
LATVFLTVVVLLAQKSAYRFFGAELEANDAFLLLVLTAQGIVSIALIFWALHRKYRRATSLD